MPEMIQLPKLSIWPTLLKQLVRARADLITAVGEEINSDHNIFFIRLDEDLSAAAALEFIGALSKAGFVAFPRGFTLEIKS